MMDKINWLIRQEDLRGYLMILGALCFAFVSMTAYTFQTFHLEQERQGKIAVMKQTVADWQEKADRINHEKLRPVKEEQVKDVKSRILFMVQGNQLNLMGVAEQADENGRLCALDVSGDWANMVNFLQNFGSNDALVGIRELAMNMENGKIQAHIVYEIYTR